MSLEVMGTKSRADKGGDNMKRDCPLRSIRFEELRRKCSGSDGMADGWVWTTGNPYGLETVHHAVAEPSSKSVIVGVDEGVVGVDASIGLSENFKFKELSLFSNIRDKLLGIREGPTVDGRSREASGGAGICWAKLEND
jgi:hypothetical protein